jgi:adenylate cyclase
VLGAVGSPTRLDYTAIGDTVNAAARVESRNKDEGTEILLGEATYRALPEGEADRLGCAARPDAVAVKGKVEKLRLYTIGVP